MRPFRAKAAWSNLSRATATVTRALPRPAQPASLSGGPAHVPQRPDNQAQRGADPPPHAAPPQSVAPRMSLDAPPAPGQRRYGQITEAAGTDKTHAGKRSRFKTSINFLCSLANLFN